MLKRFNLSKCKKVTELAQAVKMVNLGETIYQEKSTS